MTDDLSKSLSRAADQFRNEDRRKGAWSALAAIERHLNDAGCNHADLLPVREIMAALVDADKGIANPLTVPERKRAGAPQKATLKAYHEAMAAVVVSLLMDAGQSLSAASKAVSEAIGGQLSASQIVTLRKDLSGHRARPALTQFYEQLLAELRGARLPDESEPSPADRANKALRDLRSALSRKV